MSDETGVKRKKSRGGEVYMKPGICPACRGQLQDLPSGMLGCTDCDYSD